MAAVNNAQVEPTSPRDRLTNSKKVMRGRALQAYAELTPKVIQYRNEGMSFREIANALNLAGHLTRTGSSFRPTTILRMLDRAGYVSVY